MCLCCKTINKTLKLGFVLRVGEWAEPIRLSNGVRFQSVAQRACVTGYNVQSGFSVWFGFVYT